MNEKRILIIDFCNYEDFPIGGYLSFCKNMIRSFGNKLALVGITTDINDPLGKWFKKNINGTEYDYFALKLYSKSQTKFLYPDRLMSFILLRKYGRQILSIGIPNVFIQRQEVMPAIRHLNIKNICYRFPGLENPLRISKYWYGKLLPRLFDLFFFASFKNASTILATGDEKAINEMLKRSHGKIDTSVIVQFPSRLDTGIFKPGDKLANRELLGMGSNAHVVVTTGRITWLKGWKFMIDCFLQFSEKVPDSVLYIVGEGEDEAKMKSYIEQKNATAKIFTTGRCSPQQVAMYLQAADLFIMGSYKEGWSTSLIEAVATGLPACVTDFSSADSIILEGKNGYVVKDHNIDEFVAKMQDAGKLSRPVYFEHLLNYSVEKLQSELLKVWKLL